MKSVLTSMLLALSFILAFSAGNIIRSGGQGPALDKRFCADVNGDGEVDISDAINVLSYVFKGTETPYCVAQGISLEDRFNALSSRLEKLERLSASTAFVATGIFTGDGTNNRIIETGFSGKIRALSIWGVPLSGAAGRIFSWDGNLDVMPIEIERKRLDFLLSGPNFIVNHSVINSAEIEQVLGPNQKGDKYSWIAIGSQE